MSIPNVPPLVLRLCLNHGAMVIGSAANPENIKPRDWDIVVPFCNWHAACVCIPSNATINAFAGWKFTIEDIEYDIWPGDISFFLGKSEWIWSPSNKIRYQRCKE